MERNQDALRPCTLLGKRSYRLEYHGFPPPRRRRWTSKSILTRATKRFTVVSTTAIEDDPESRLSPAVGKAKSRPATQITEPTPSSSRQLHLLPGRNRR